MRNISYVKKTKGYANVLGFRLFFRKFTPPIFKGTVLCLHGGPGATHDYILPLSDLSRFGFQVVFYDQLGCGRSELPRDLSLFTIERGVEEVEAFRKKLKLGKIHLMGSSYGGLLALAYALKYQQNLRSIISTGGIASMPLCIQEMVRLKSELPSAIKKIIDRYEAAGDYENPKYEEAVMFFYKRHLLRLEKWPTEQKYTMTHMSKPVYSTMNGPNEFTIIGNLRYFDITSELHKIRVPTLVTGGKYDEVTPAVARSIHRNIKGSELKIFRKSSHLAMWEEREKYIEALRDFLARAEA